MAEPNLVQIKIPRSGAARVNIYMQDGTVDEKFIRIQDLTSMLSSKSVNVNALLPKDCVKYSAYGNTSNYAILKPEGQQYVNVESAERGHVFDRVLVPRPWTMWVFRVKEGSVASTIVGLVKPEEVEAIQNGDLRILNGDLRHLPFPNVFSNNGICWGSTSVDKLMRIEGGVKYNTFEPMITSYWISPSNYHLDAMAMSSGKLARVFPDGNIPFHTGSKISFIRDYLANKEVFPYDLF